MCAHPSPFEPGPRRRALTLALLGGLACQGCASLALTQQVSRQPKYGPPGAARSVQGTYLGLTRTEGGWHYAFRFPDFVWTGPRVRREVFVLVPAAPSGRPAVVVGGDVARVPEALRRHLGAGPAADLERRRREPAHPGAPAAARVSPAGEERPVPPLPRGTGAGSPEHPAALDFRVGARGRVEAMRVAWGTREGLEWTGPFEVTDRVERPTWGARAARPLSSLGYLVTVPLDVVTLPAQLAAGLLLLVALSAG